MDLINRQELIDAAHLDKLRLGFTADVLMRIFRLHKLNKLYSDFEHEKGVHFIDGVIESLGIRYALYPEEEDRIPREGAFIVVANHPFGLLDGLMMIRLIAGVRPDFKVMANYLLQRLETLESFFIPVDPFGTKDSTQKSLGGIKQFLQHLQAGHPVGIFPAGEVSSFQAESKLITDREWQKSAVKVIYRAKVPVLPIFFHGSNSFIFHLLSRINPKFRTAGIPAELFNKNHHTLRIRVGNPVLPETLAEMGSEDEAGRFLRAKVYALGMPLSVKKFFRPKFSFPQKPREIAPPVDRQLLRNELVQIRSRALIHTKNQFEVFTADAEDIPNMIQEIGRAREVTFRQVGEGTNRKTDLDEYDLYYKHLFVWDREAELLVGAYRLGKGSEIVPKLGVKGFYTSSLFTYHADFLPVLAQAVELGRSFVVKEYQQKPQPLFLLWQGILVFLLRNPGHQFIIGPVSISNHFSHYSKSFLITFIKLHFWNEDLAQLVKPKKGFEPDFQGVDTQLVLKSFHDKLEKLDKFIAEIEPSRYRIPVLLKKYIKQNARIIGFNIDPKFNNALDGLMILNLDDVPSGTLENLRKEMNIQQEKS